MESGLSPNSLSAYGADLKSFSDFLIKQSSQLLNADHASLLNYMAVRSSQVSARTSARSLSSLKRFYRWLLRESMVKTDPSASIKSPKLNKTLPE